MDRSGPSLPTLLDLSAYLSQADPLPTGGLTVGSEQKYQSEFTFPSTAVTRSLPTLVDLIIHFKLLPESAS